MNSKTYEITIKDYLIPIFRHKAVIITTFVVVMITVVIGLMLKTPVYKASVKMLISASKLTSSPYYRDLAGYQQTQVSLTQSEIVKSAPVLIRAANALKLNERPSDYEKNFCSPLKAWLIGLKLLPKIGVGFFKAFPLQVV